MLSGATNHSFISLTFKSYLYKLRAYSGYFCGLVLLQVLASVTMTNGSYTNSMNFSDLNITMHTHSSLFVLLLSVVWAFIISGAIPSRPHKEASFSFPGNRLTDCCSDIAYIVTGCLFGGITTALAGVASRTVIYFLFPGSVLAPGFFPVFNDLCTITAAVSLYMLLISGVGYLAGTIIRINQILIVVVAFVLIFVLFFLNIGGLASYGIIANHLLRVNSLALFALLAVIISAFFFVLSTLIAFRLEVKKQ